MTLDGNHKPAPLPFDDWKLQLRKDCELEGKLFAFNAMGEYALKLLWEDDIDPSVKAIVGSVRSSTAR